MNATQRKIILIAGAAMLAVNVGLNLLLWGRTWRLERMLSSLQDQGESQYLSLQDQLNSRMDTLSDQVSSGESLLSYWDTQVGMGDGHTLAATVIVTPKEIGEGDTVSISIGEISAEAEESGGSYTATLSIPASPSELVPVVTITTAGGTKRQEVLPSVSTAEFFEVYYSFDVTVSDRAVQYSAGFQPGGNSVLSLPDDIAAVWLNVDWGDGQTERIPMAPDGDRIPDTAGVANASPESAVPAAGADVAASENAGAGSLSYSYYSAGLRLPEGESGFICNLFAEMETVYGTVYQIEPYTLLSDSASAGGAGGGNLYPEWEEEG